MSNLYREYRGEVTFRTTPPGSSETLEGICNQILQGLTSGYRSGEVIYCSLLGRIDTQEVKVRVDYLSDQSLQAGSVRGLELTEGIVSEATKQRDCGYIILKYHSIFEPAF